MIKILLILVAIGAIFCLYVMITCLFAAFSENELPDIEDVDVSGIIRS